jgi:N-acetylmuramoyl-L-alanine amidase
MNSFGNTARKYAATTFHPATVLLIAFALLCAVLPPAVGADNKKDSEKQYDRAVKMRTMLEGYLERDRSLNDYQQTAQAFRKVYLITPEAPDATPALVAEAELDETMGRMFDPKYFRDAIGRYNFLLKQYPGTKFRGDALLAIGKIQKDDLKSKDDAEATFQEFLQKYPRSEKAAVAQQALRELRMPAASSGTLAQLPPAAGGDAEKSRGARQRTEELMKAENVADVQADLRGQAVEPHVGDRVATVSKVQTWNSPDSTRIVVTLNDTIAYESARIAEPDRIYFNLHRAQVSAKLTRNALQVDDGLLQSVRIAQNKADVVRLVLYVSGEKDYSTFLLSNPYRLVIDLHTRGTTNGTASNTGSTAKGTSADTQPTIASNLATVTPNHEATPAVNLDKSSTALPEVSAPPDSLPTKTAKSLARIPSPSRLSEKTVLPLSKGAGKTTALLQPPPIAKPTRDGQRSLTRALGLKISRIVIDAGHGGHDTGTIGPHGLMEKDLCLDVALRLGQQIEEKLPGAEVVYTRKDDTFIPLKSEPTSPMRRKRICSFRFTRIRAMTVRRAARKRTT